MFVLSLTREERFLMGEKTMKGGTAQENFKLEQIDLRILIKTIPDLVWLKDIDGKYLFCNPKFERYIGTKESDILGKSDFDFNDEKLALFYHKNDLAALESNASLTNIEWLTYADDGHKELVETIKTPMYSSNGKLIGVLGIARDITDRYNATESMQESEANYRLFFEGNPMPMWIFDILTLRFLDINQAAITLYGYTKDEFLSMTIKDIKPAEDVEELLKNLSIIRENVRYSNVVKHIKKNKEIIYAEITSNVIKFKNRKCRLALIKDITDRKLAETELIKAKEKAEESDRLKTAFLNNISHEIRTPLNGIVGFSALLTEPGIDPKTQSLSIDSIQKCSDQLLTIINDIVDIANVTAKTTTSYITNVNLNSLCDRTAKRFKNEASGKNINFSYVTDFPSDKCEIMTDNSMLTRILSNLINNAIKFTPQGEVKFGYKQKDSFVEFFVTDSGIGIPLEYHPRIFQNFYQVEQSISGFHEGTGLGLPICKAFIEHLGGNIWFESEPKKGSTFYFTLPYIQPEKINKSDILNKIPEKSMPTRQKTILVAEDDMINFKLIERLLTDFQVKIIHAVNGSDAVEICKNEKNIDLILMDIKMPGIDGYTAARYIRETSPEIKIIAQTAYATDNNIALENGFNGFISKPYQKGQFISKVKEFLDKV